jgi:hypothetical protein
MSSLPPALDFPATEEAICAQWKKDDTFKNQDQLAKERGDKVCSACWFSLEYILGMREKNAIFQSLETANIALISTFS